MQIVSFGQIVDLEEGGVLGYQVVVLLPSGIRIPIKTDESTVSQLMSIMNEEPPPSSTYEYEDVLVQPTSHPVGYSEQPPDIYEDDLDDPGEMNVGGPHSSVMGQVAEEAVSRTADPVDGLGQGRRIPPRVDKDGFLLPAPAAATVPMNEAGFPIVQRNPGARLVNDDDGDGDQM